MATAHHAPITFAELLWPARGASRPLRALLLALLGSALLTISAKIEVPFYPVPMTMQTLVVLLLGMAFGARLGAATVLLYLAEGAVGLPVFAGTPERGIGIAYMLGPTGGYLVGFVLSAAITGWLTERRRDWPRPGARGHRRHDRRVHPGRALAGASDRLRAEHRARPACRSCGARCSRARSRWRWAWPVPR